IREEPFFVPCCRSPLVGDIFRDNASGPVALSPKASRTGVRSYGGRKKTRLAAGSFQDLI
ncbi:hypothetical protein, partial [Luteibacter yeojuensis]|uniref:hypothetical protein n=1 Tax=Luteibacter yeojuensis TaxID=345309 RepID=UPI001E461EB5